MFASTLSLTLTIVVKPGSRIHLSHSVILRRICKLCRCQDRADSAVITIIIELYQDLGGRISHNKVTPRSLASDDTVQRRASLGRRGLTSARATCSPSLCQLRGTLSIRTLKKHPQLNLPQPGHTLAHLRK